MQFVAPGAKRYKKEAGMAGVVYMKISDLLVVFLCTVHVFVCCGV